MKDWKENYRQKFALKDNVKVIKREEYEDILLYQETYIEKLLSQQRKKVFEEVLENMAVYYVENGKYDDGVYTLIKSLFNKQ